MIYKQVNVTISIRLYLQNHVDLLVSVCALVQARSEPGGHLYLYCQCMANMMSRWPYLLQGYFSITRNLLMVIFVYIFQILVSTSIESFSF